MSMLATSRDEVPAFFPAGGESLFGILTRPTGKSNETAVIVLSGGGAPISTERNRFSVRLCRRLAAEGFHTMRFDYHGAGESSGVIEKFRLDEPFTDDLAGVIDWVRLQGIHKFVLVGLSCFGARTALSFGPQVEGLQTIVLNSTPVRDFEMGERVSTRLALEWSPWDYIRNGMRWSNITRLTRARGRHKIAMFAKTKWRAVRSGGSDRDDATAQASWLAPVSERFAGPLLELTKSEIPVLLIYGTNDDFYADFQRAKEGELGEILDHPAVEIATLPGKLHGLGDTDTQDSLLNLICGWVPRKVGVGAEGAMG